MNQNGRTGLHGDGLGAAEAVFERVLASLEGPPAAPTADGNGHSAPTASRVRLTQVRSAAARTLDLYGELFQRAFETYADLAQAALQPGTDPAPETPLALAGPAGGEATTRLWLHNLSAGAVHDVTLFLTDLTAAGGDRIAAHAADLTPALVYLDPGASVSTVLRFAIPSGTATGLYHGHVLSPALPASALGVRLAVEP